MNYRIYTDGASRGNPGLSGAGGIIYSPEGEIVGKVSEFLGTTTNNVAEYQALRLTLERATKLGIKNADIFMDSKLIVEQMNGKWKIKNENLKGIHLQIKELVVLFDNISFKHIYRHLNTQADSLANEAINNLTRR
jgi:ribonuclease HI